MVGRYIHTSKIIDISAPYDVDVGDFVKINSLFGISCFKAKAGHTTTIRTCGVYELPKITGEAWKVGNGLIFDEETKSLKVSNTETTFHAFAVKPALSDDKSGHALIA